MNSFQNIRLFTVYFQWFLIWWGFHLIISWSLVWIFIFFLETKPNISFCHCLLIIYLILEHEHLHSLHILAMMCMQEQVGCCCCCCCCCCCHCILTASVGCTKSFTRCIVVKDLLVKNHCSIKILPSIWSHRAIIFMMACNILERKVVAC